MDKTPIVANKPVDLSLAPTRRQVTVMFCDLVNYSSMLDNLDPELVGDIVDFFHKICTEVAAQDGGHIHEYLGDGVVMLFGYPRANERDAECAIRAALGIIQEVKNHNKRPTVTKSRHFKVRIGITTGEVVFKQAAPPNARSYQLTNDKPLITTIGKPPALASRIQNAAEPNTVLISVHTKQLAGRTFQYERIGKFYLKGFDKHDYDLWQVIRENHQQFNHIPRLKRLQTRFVSRQQELARLTDSAATALLGRPHFFELRGDAGLGKSCLIRRFEKQLNKANLFRIRLNCNPTNQNTPFKAITDETLRWFQLSPKDNLRTIQTNIDWGMETLGIQGRPEHGLFYDMMDVPRHPGVPEVTHSTERKRQLIVRMMARICLMLTRMNPVVLIIEDIHWIDPSSLQVVNEILKLTRDEPVFGIFSTRPEFTFEWNDSRANIEIMELQQLDFDDTYKLLGSILNQELPRDLLEHMHQKSGGNPLYLEELAWQLRKHGDSSNWQRALNYHIPVTLQDMLNARIDSLSGGKVLAQIAACFSGSFCAEDLQAIADENRIEFPHNFEELLSSGLFNVNKEKDPHVYSFKHHLIREAAHYSLLHDTKDRYHLQIVDLLIRKQPDLPASNPSILAFHYTHTTQHNQAISTWLTAGDKAMEQFAIHEAINHFNAGLAVIDNLERRSDKQQKLKLKLLIRVASAYTFDKGCRHQRAYDAYIAALDLSQRYGDKRERWLIYFGLWRASIHDQAFSETSHYVKQMMKLAHKTQDPQMLIANLGIHVTSHFYFGNFKTLTRCYLQQQAMNEQQPETDFINSNLFDVPIRTAGIYALSLAIQNHPDTDRQVTESLRTADETAQPFTIAYTQRFVAINYLIREKHDAFAPLINQLTTKAQSFGYSEIAAGAKIMMMYGRFLRKPSVANCNAIHLAYKDFTNAGAVIFSSFFLSLLARAQLQLGQYQDAHATIIKALELANLQRECWYYSELLLLKYNVAQQGGLSDPHELNSLIKHIRAKALEINSQLTLVKLEKLQD